MSKYEHKVSQHNQTKKDYQPDSKNPQQLVKLQYYKILKRLKHNLITTSNHWKKKICIQGLNVRDTKRRNNPTNEKPRVPQKCSWQTDQRTELENKVLAFHGKGVQWLTQQKSKLHLSFPKRNSRTGSKFFLQKINQPTVHAHYK